MPLLDRQFLKELIYNLVFTFVVISSIFMIGAVVGLLHKHPEMDILLFINLIPFQMLQGLPFVLPMSMLISDMTLRNSAGGVFLLRRTASLS